MPARPLSRPVLVAAALALLAAGTASGDEAPQPERGRHLDLVLDRYTHDFGVAPQHARRETTLTYTNRSAHPVEGIRARGSCGCNEVRVSATTLAPGASGTLTVVFATGTLSGRLTKHVDLVSGDPRRGLARIRQHIAIIEGLIVSPGAVTFRDVFVGTTPTASFRVRWFEGHGRPVRVTAVRVPGHAFRTRITPYEDPQEPAWKGWTVALTFEQPPPRGTVSAEVVVETDHPDHPRLTLPLSAHVSGHVWLQASKLTLGAFAQGSERKGTILFRPFRAEVPFGDVQARARAGRVRVAFGPHPVHGESGHWFLSVTAPPDAAPGPLRDVIELDTGIPQEGLIEVPVEGFVKRPRKDDDHGD